MSEVTEYFLRHYTLVIDNDQVSYLQANGSAQDVVLNEGVTFAEYQAMTGQERADRFASAIGDAIMSLIGEWWDAVPNDSGVGYLLASELMVLADSELEWALGDHYMPEPSDLEELLESGDDDE